MTHADEACNDEAIGRTPSLSFEARLTSEQTSRQAREGREGVVATGCNTDETIGSDPFDPARTGEADGAGFGPIGASRVKDLRAIASSATVCHER